MPPLLRRTLAVLAGATTSVLVVVVSDGLVGAIYPLPEGTDLADRESLARGIAAMPMLAHLLLLAGWALAGLTGAWVAVRLTNERWPVAGWLTVAILVAATVANLTMLPHPGWMLPAALIAIPLMGWVGIRLASAPRPAGAPAA